MNQRGPIGAAVLYLIALRYVCEPFATREFIDLGNSSVWVVMLVIGIVFIGLKFVNDNAAAGIAAAIALISFAIAVGVLIVGQNATVINWDSESWWQVTYISLTSLAYSAIPQSKK
ncbi:hypothetical protein HGA91_04495 [candidate division WWE3 bacterium]|nr:hypothetical protein [candidate division WWE3 bacterium]